MPLGVVESNFQKLVKSCSDINSQGNFNHPVFNTQHFPYVKISDSLFKKYGDLGSVKDECVKREENSKTDCFSTDEKRYIPLTKTLNSFTIGPVTCDITPRDPYKDSFISRCHANIRGRSWEAVFQEDPKNADVEISCSEEAILPGGMRYKGNCGIGKIKEDLFQKILKPASLEDLSLPLVTDNPPVPPPTPSPVPDHDLPILDPIPPIENSGVSLTSAALAIGGIGLVLYAGYKVALAARKYFAGGNEEAIQVLPSRSRLVPQQHYASGRSSASMPV